MTRAETCARIEAVGIVPVIRAASPELALRAAEAVLADGGPKYLRALRGPLPDVKLLPTGGVNATTAADYIAAGAAALGVGSELVDPAALARGDDALLTTRARELLAAVAAARAGG